MHDQKIYLFCRLEFEICVEWIDLFVMLVSIYIGIYRYGKSHIKYLMHLKWGLSPGEVMMTKKHKHVHAHLFSLGI
jgi:hypothetical protein